MLIESIILTHEVECIESALYRGLTIPSDIRLLPRHISYKMIHFSTLLIRHSPVKFYQYQGLELSHKSVFIFHTFDRSIFENIGCL